MPTPRFCAHALVACVSSSRVQSVLAFALAHAPDSRAAATPKPDRAALKMDLENFFGGIEKLDAALPREEFEIEALADAQQRDTKKLRDWVATHTRWIPYAGALRGAEGVLFERRGNSLDRALLLAALLEASGYAPQLAHATLAEADAKKVVELSRAPLPVVPASERLNQMATSLIGALKSLPPEPEAKPDSALEHLGAKGVREQAEWIVANVKRAGVPTPEHAPDLLAAAADHWWVRIDAASGMINLDPDARDLVNGHFDVEADSVAAVADLSTDVRQRVTVKVIVERWSEGALSESDAASAEITLGRDALPALTLEHDSPDWKGVTPPSAADEILAAVAETKRWQPFLTVAGATIAGKIFDETGWVSEGTDASPAGLGAAAGGLLGGFGGGDEPTPKKPTVFTAEWLDFHIVMPGGSERVVRREIVDLLGPARRAQPISEKPVISAERVAGARLRLGAEVKMRLLNCRPSQVYFDHAMLAWMLSLRESCLAFVANEKPSAEDRRRFLDAQDPFDPLLDFALVRGLAGDATTFENGPLVVSCFENPARLASGKIGMNRVFDVADNPTTSSAGDFAAIVRPGVADTAAEFYALSRRPRQPQSLHAGCAARRAVSSGVRAERRFALDLGKIA